MQRSGSPLPAGVLTTESITDKLHGVVSNYWFDQALHDRFYCVEDPESQLVGGATV